MSHHLASDFERLHNQVERMWSTLVRGAGAPPSYACFAFDPPADVYERDDAVVVVVEIAGIRDTGVELRSDGRSLTIRGERHGHLDDQGRAYAQIEVCRGEFQRTLPLPAPVRATGMHVSYEDGFLRIVLPKAPGHEAFHIHLRTA